MIATVKRCVVHLIAVPLGAALAAAPVHAEPVHLDATAFTFDSEYYQQADTLLSDSKGVTTIALNDAASLMAMSYQWQYIREYEGTYQLEAKPGYQITGYALSGAYEGEYRVGQNPAGYFGRPGSADSSGSISLSGPAGSTLASVSNLNGSSPFRLESGALTADALQLSVWAFSTGSAGPAVWSGFEEDSINNYYDFSFAFLGLRDPTLTVYSRAIAVPEPHTYAMVLAGLFLVGAAARRRSDGKVACTTPAG